MATTKWGVMPLGLSLTCLFCGWPRREPDRHLGGILGVVISMDDLVEHLAERHKTALLLTEREAGRG